ncbi:hypothetical protein BDV96DRAFT_567333, partial [Lophiotrema nucula]
MDFTYYRDFALTVPSEVAPSKSGTSFTHHLWRLTCTNASTYYYLYIQTVLQTSQTSPVQVY